MRKALITIPAYEGKLSATTVASLFNDWPTCAGAGIALSLDQQMGCSDLPHARQWCLSQFLASGADDWITVDWDVGWAPGVLLRLLQHKVDVIMGVYPAKNDKPEFVVSYPSGRMVIEENGLARITAGPAGFLRVSRSAAEKMIIKYKDLIYRNENSPTFGKLWGLFEKTLEKGERVGEDISFIHRWTKMGEVAWVDPSFRMFHTGIKVWEGCLMEYETLKQKVAA